MGVSRRRLLKQAWAGLPTPTSDQLGEAAMCARSSATDMVPGAARKTANVVLGTAFGIASGVVVDTHVTRLSRRLGLTKANDAVKIERDLIALLPKKHWVAFSHELIQHGRRVCQARKPNCDECSLNKFCPRVGVKAG